MVAELLSHELGAPARTESAHGPGDGLPDLSGTGLVAALQHRHEQGVGPDSADAGLVCRWLHREPPVRWIPGYPDGDLGIAPTSAEPPSPLVIHARCPEHGQ